MKYYAHPSTIWLALPLPSIRKDTPKGIAMMKIEITQQDIDNGMKDRVDGCAIALGLKHEFTYEISVAPGWIWIGKDWYQATPEVDRWIADFDKGKPVKPITIELVQSPIPKKNYPKNIVYTEGTRNDIHNPKYRRTKVPPGIQVCGIARIADSQR